MEVEFDEGYLAGFSNHVTIEDTVDEAPEPDTLTPYEKGTPEYIRWRCGFIKSYS